MRFLHKGLAAAALLCAVAAPHVALAKGIELGATFATVQADYPAATVAAPHGGSRRLELHEIDYAGLHWKTVAFVFDAQDHLQAVKLNTRTETLESVQGVVLAQMQALDSGLTQAADDGADTMQIRVCESSDTGVTLTMEPMSTET